MKLYKISVTRLLYHVTNGEFGTHRLKFNSNDKLVYIDDDIFKFMYNKDTYSLRKELSNLLESLKNLKKSKSSFCNKSLITMDDGIFDLEEEIKDKQNKLDKISNSYNSLETYDAFEFI